MRSFLMWLLLAARVDASPSSIDVHASCSEHVASDAAHLRTLRGEVARGLDAAVVTEPITLDVSLVRLVVVQAGSEVEVRAEVKAFVSDQGGRVRFSSSARSLARGAARERNLVQRDAVTAAARELTKLIRRSLAR